MPNNQFTNKQVQHTVNRVLSEHDLTIEHTMSTSGEFFVRTATRGKQKFLLKIRQTKTKESKQRFVNEIQTNKLIQKTSIPHLYTTRFLTADTTTEPEYLLYEFMTGYPLSNYYFYISKGRIHPRIPRLLRSHIFEVITTIQKIKPTAFPKTCSLQTKKFADNYTEFTRYTKALDGTIEPKTQERAARALNHFHDLFDSTPAVLTHGDFNPKNILLDKTKLSIVDWSDVHYNNPMYDLATLYLYAWQHPEIQDRIEQHIAKAYTKINDAKRLFELNQLLLLPKVITVTKNSIAGIADDYAHKKITQQQADELTAIGDHALASQYKRFTQLTRLLNQFLKDTQLTESIKLFSNPKTTLTFFNHSAQNILPAKATSVQIKTLRIDILPTTQKFIAEYILHTNKTIELLGKIRHVRGQDLSKHSYTILKRLWNNQSTRELISQPLAHYPRHCLYIYKKTPGNSIADYILQHQHLGRQFERLLVQAGNVLNKLHRIPRSFFDGITFVESYTTPVQIQRLAEHIQNHPQHNTHTNNSLVSQIQQLHAETKDVNSTSFIHGDAQLENFIVYRNKIRLIDFDNAVLDDPMVDVGNMLKQINYRGLLGNRAHHFRNVFLANYTKKTAYKHAPDYFKRINLYCIMGIVKNINHNFQTKDLVAINKDLLAIQYILSNISDDPATILTTAYTS